jgi:8-oxo-dGTP pyrophosphatase MutT (NUDIX family)
LQLLLRNAFKGREFFKIMKLSEIIGRQSRIAARTTASREERKKVALQTGALPWRIARGSKPEIMLVTGRRSGRWMIPKGWPMIGRSLADAAAREAFEEAGISGTIDPNPLGSFHHEKRSLFGTVEVEILVHLLAVDKELPEWPERGQRERKWFPVKEAVTLVDSDELGKLIARVGKRLRKPLR